MVAATPDSVEIAVPVEAVPNNAAAVNAILYKARTGATWRSLPEEYGSCGTASIYFNRWAKDGTWARIDDALSMVARVPLPAFEPLPPMRIEGRFDPRVMLLPGE